MDQNATAQPSAFDQAVALYQQGRFQEALAVAKKGLALRPRHAGLLNLAGVAAHGLGLADDAECYWRAAIAARPDLPDPHGNLATLLRGRGRLDEAEAAYRHALTLRPHSAETHYNLGALLLERGRLDEAEAAFRQALALCPRYAQAYHGLGRLLYERGRLEEAEAAFRQALAIQPDNAEVYTSLAALLKDRGHPQEAEVACRRAVALQSRHADAYNELGNALYHCGNMGEEAEAAYRQALALNPRHADAYNNLGNVLKARDELTEAEAAYRQALALNPRHADVYGNLGALLRQRGRLTEAEAAYQQALVFRPQCADTYYNLGNLLHECQRPEQAEAAYRQALAIRPTYVEVYHNLGLLLRGLGRLEEAEAAYRQALALRPLDSGAYAGMGLLLYERGCLDEAEAAYRRTLELAPDHAQARCNLGILLLSLGRFAEGWSAYEARWDLATKQATGPSFPFPRWNGESLAGKALLLIPEQGFGDQIQFCRYVPMLKRRGAARVGILCDSAMVALLETFDGIDAVISNAASAQALDGYDYWTLPLSIPLHLETTLDTIPAHLPYLHARPERVRRWAERLPTAGLRVGLVWKGRPTHRNDANRSLPGLRTLAPLWSVPGVAFVSLQKGAGEDAAAAPPDGQPLIHLGSDIEDFADTAAIVSQLDLVICVDTAIAHLAGALGKPCWVLLPALTTDWRWLHGRADSPWYPGVMRLFRQATPGDWAAVVAQVAQCLRDQAMRR